MTIALPSLPRIVYEHLVRDALREDLGRAGDLTSDSIVPSTVRTKAEVRTRRAGRVGGLEASLLAFHLLDPEVDIEILRPDGRDVEVGDVLATVSGRARAVLSAERTALNLLGRMAGIATTTRDLVRSIEGSGAQIVCTRKTTPLWRALEKHAVKAGGGSNHRFGLDDAILIKDNHRALAGSAAEAVRRAKAHAGHLVKIEVEVDDLDELDDILCLGIDAVLLDNMDAETLRRAVEIVDGRAITEASGGITPATAPGLAASGVDLLSVGWLTHSAPVLDVGLDIEFSD